MARWAPQRRDVVAQLVDELLHNYARGRALVAVDGPPDAGQRALADDLATESTRRGHAAFRASIDDFRRPRADRERLGDAPAVRYAETYDYSTFRRVLVEPFRMGEGAAFVTAAFDADRDAPIPPKWRSGPRDAILLVDGVQLLRPELRGLWNASLWMQQRDREVDAVQAVYEAESAPRTAATIIIDASDPDVPRRVFADSC